MLSGFQPTAPSRPSKISNIPPRSPRSLPFPPGTQPSRKSCSFLRSPEWPVNVHVNSSRRSPHVDVQAGAPLHYAKGEASLGELDVAPYLSTCRFIQRLGCSPLVEPGNIARTLDGLLHTYCYVSLHKAHVSGQSSASFAAIASKKLVSLATKNVALIVIKICAVDPATIQGSPSHNQHTVLSLRAPENLVPNEVAEGGYELIALSQKIIRVMLCSFARHCANERSRARSCASCRFPQSFPQRGSNTQPDPTP